MLKIGQFVCVKRMPELRGELVSVVEHSAKGRVTFPGITTDKWFALEDLRAVSRKTSTEVTPAMLRRYRGDDSRRREVEALASTFREVHGRWPTEEELEPYCGR